MLVGLTGYAQHGKDTAGAYLVEAHGFKRFAFADTLKQAATALDPYIPYEAMLANERPDNPLALETRYVRLSEYIDMVGPEEAKANPEVRRTYQVLGSEVGRDLLGEDVWVNALELRLRDECTWTFPWMAKTATEASVLPKSVLASDVVITDVRFPNEAAAIRAWGGQVWRIVRLTGGNVVDPETGEDTGEVILDVFDNGLGTDHPSEKFIAELPVDCVLYATDVADLQKGVESAYQDGPGVPLVR